MDMFLSAYHYSSKSLNATFNNNVEEYKNGAILARDKKVFVEAKHYRGEVSLGPIFISNLGPSFDNTKGKVSLDFGKDSRCEDNGVTLAFLRLAPALENNPCAFQFIYEHLKEEGILPHCLNLLLQESYGHTVSIRIRGSKKNPMVWPLHSLVQGGHRLISLASDALKIRMCQKLLANKSEINSTTITVNQVNMNEINDKYNVEKFIGRLIDLIGKASRIGGYAVVGPQSLLMLRDGSMTLSSTRGIAGDSFLFSKLFSLDQRLLRILKFNREEVYREMEMWDRNDGYNNNWFRDSFSYRMKRFDDTFLLGKFSGTSNVQDHRNRTIDNFQRICRDFISSSILSIFELINKDLYHLLDANARSNLNSYFFTPLYLNEICLGRNMSNVFTFMKNMVITKEKDNVEYGKCLIGLIEELSDDMIEIEKNRKSIIETITSDITEEDIQMISEEITDPEKVSEVVNKNRELKRKSVRNLVKYYVGCSMEVFTRLCKIPHQPQISLEENASSVINNAFFRMVFFCKDVSIHERAIVVRNMCDFLNLLLVIYFFVDVPTALAEKNAAIFQRNITDRDVTFFKNLMETTKRKMPKCLLNMYFLNPHKSLRCRNHYSCNLVRHFTWVKEHGTEFFDRYIKPLFTSSCELDCLGEEMIKIYLEDTHNIEQDPFAESFCRCNHESQLMSSIKRFLQPETYIGIIEGDVKKRERFFENELDNLRKRRSPDKIKLVSENRMRKRSSSVEDSKATINKKPTIVLKKKLINPYTKLWLNV